MKKSSKSALYSTIKSTVKKLGISAEDTTGIINYIKFIESGTLDKAEVKNVNKKESRINSTEDVILSILSKDANKEYSIQDLVDASGLNYTKVRTLLKDLKTSRKIKVVGYVSGSAGPSKLLYQTWKSPLKALKLVTEKQGFSTVHGFIKNHKKLLSKGIGITSFALAVEESGITSYPLSLSIGITKGYRNTDLKALALGGSNEKSKKINKPKRKYTKKVKVESVESPVMETKNNISFIGKLFRKNSRNTSELIKF